MSMPPLDTHVLFALVANFYYISQLVEIFDSVIHGLGVFTTGLISWGFLLRGFVLGFPFLRFSIEWCIRIERIEMLFWKCVHTLRQYALSSFQGRDTKSTC